jgi:hypothetical protein
MSLSDAEVRELQSQYRDVEPLDVRREGARYRARLSDGTAVIVTALATEIATRLLDHGEFVARLRSAGTLRIEGIPRVPVVDRSPGGVLHFATEADDAVPFEPESVPAGELARVGAELARTIHTAHRAGIVHGAITTERIARTAAGIRVDGLGLADALHAAGMDRSEASLALADVAFVAPEVQTGAPPDARSDVYGLGASLYEILTGKAPFGGRTTSFVMATVLSDEDATTGEQLTSGPIVDAILRAIEANPSDRWPDAESFARALDAGAGSTALAADGATSRGCLSRAAALVALIAGAAGIATFVAS